MGTFTPETGKLYRIEVIDSDLGSAEAESDVPKQVNISNAKAVKIEWGQENYTSYRFNFSFVIEDPKTEDYYYMIIKFPVYHIDTLTYDTTFVEFQYCEIETGDLPLHQLYKYNGLIFTDKAFNGTNHLVSGSATTYQDPFSESTSGLPWDVRNKCYFVDFSKIYITVSHINKELYRFYSSHAQLLANENDLYSEPVPVYCNIKNGFGIFGSENITIKKVKVVNKQKSTTLTAAMSKVLNNRNKP